MPRPFTLDSLPGIQRDGTPFDAKRALDSLWCRWRLGRPRKMGGFQSITDGLGGLPRRVHCWYNGSRVISHVGTVNGIQQVIFDNFGNLISVTDRTPTTFLGGADTGFTMDAIFDTTSNVVQLVAHAAPDDGFLSTPISTVPFIGQIDGSSPLIQFSNPGPLAGGAVWTQPDISGGICCVQPFVFDFDSNGLLQWSAPNLPLYLGVTGGSTGAGQARVSAQKVVQGMALRGGGVQSPAALFWSLSEVITATYIGGTPVFAFNTISPSSSILSSDSVVEYDGLYFWAGIDRFLVFNGTVTEVPNQQNQDWFFDNLTPGYESQTFATKIPRYGEIWWCACMFGSTVPNYACIFNLRENCWYDTALPLNTWSAGFFAQGFKRPLFAGQDTDGLYKLWMAETGTDKVDGATVTPIRSYFDTAFFGGPKNDPPDDKGLSIADLQPDIIQTGDMIVNLIGTPNARAQPTNGPALPLLLVPGSPQEQAVSFTPTQSQRLSQLHVESNVVGGSYITGRNIMHGDPAEARKYS
jgi:hypothetical protein